MEREEVAERQREQESLLSDLGACSLVPGSEQVMQGLYEAICAADQAYVDHLRALEEPHSSGPDSDAGSDSDVDSVGLEDGVAEAGSLANGQTVRASPPSPPLTPSLSLSGPGWDS